MKPTPDDGVLTAPTQNEYNLPFSSVNRKRTV